MEDKSSNLLQRAFFQCWKVKNNLYFLVVFIEFFYESFFSSAEKILQESKTENVPKKVIFNFSKYVLSDTGKS